MLKAASSQDVGIMIATPHFYASRNTIDAFLCSREEAYQKLQAGIEASGEAHLPQIRLGAEVAYFEGISKADRIDELTIRGTNLLLLELPFTEWTKRVVDEVELLIKKRHFRIILAHLERFMGNRANRGYIDELLEIPLLVQINAESFESFWQRRKLIRMFQRGEAHLLGSDCHGIHHRIPNLKDGRDALASGGVELLDEIDRRGEKLLESQNEENK
jgi:protein-tyrosine phosphatase